MSRGTAAPLDRLFVFGRETEMMRLAPFHRFASDADGAVFADDARDSPAIARNLFSVVAADEA